MTYDKTYPLHHSRHMWLEMITGENARRKQHSRMRLYSLETPFAIGQMRLDDGSGVAQKLLAISSRAQVKLRNRILFEALIPQSSGTSTSRQTTTVPPSSVGQPRTVSTMLTKILLVATLFAGFVMMILGSLAMPGSR